MSYGIQLTNDFGDRVLESTGIFFEQARGTMNWAPPSTRQNNLNVYRQQSLNSRFVRWIHADRPLARTPLNRICYDITDGGDWSYPGGGGQFTTGHDYDAAIIQWSGDSDFNNATTRTIPNPSGVSGGRRVEHVPNAIANTTDFGGPGDPIQELFFRIPTRGLHSFGSVFNPYTNFYAVASQGITAFGMQDWREGEGLEYVVGTTQVPALDGSEYGMVVRDEDNNTIFDTRFVQNAIRIKDYITITSGEIDDCLENDATYDYTIRTPVNTPYIGGDSFLGYNVSFSGNNHDYFYPTLRVLNNTSANPTLRMTRKQYRFRSRSDSITLPGGSQNSRTGTYLIADI